MKYLEYIECQFPRPLIMQALVDLFGMTGAGDTVYHKNFVLYYT